MGDGCGCLPCVLVYCQGGVLFWGTPGLSTAGCGCGCGCLPCVLVYCQGGILFWGTPGLSTADLDSDALDPEKQTVRHFTFISLNKGTVWPVSYGPSFGRPPPFKDQKIQQHEYLEKPNEVLHLSLFSLIILAVIFSQPNFFQKYCRRTHPRKCGT